MLLRGTIASRARIRQGYPADAGLATLPCAKLAAPREPGKHTSPIGAPWGAKSRVVG